MMTFSNWLKIKQSEKRCDTKKGRRNPNVMDILREIGLAEKTGSGFDKIFTDLLNHFQSQRRPRHRLSFV